MTLERVVRAAVIAAAVLMTGLAARASGADTPDDQARGSGRLVNVETPDTVSTHELTPRFDVRFFDQPEATTNASLSFRYGLTRNIELGLRGTTGATRAFALPNGATLFHGGQDLELFGKVSVGSYSGVRVGALAGVSFPDTPAQNQAAFTFGGSASLAVGSRASLTLNPRAVFLDSNTIAGIGVGASYRASDHVQIMADWTPIVSGDNTRDLATGARKRRDVWGAAVRFGAPSGDDRLELDLGYGNSIGTTTGFSLTPGLGDSAGFFLALRVRR